MAQANAEYIQAVNRASEYLMFSQTRLYSCSAREPPQPNQRAAQTHARRARHCEGRSWVRRPRCDARRMRSRYLYSGSSTSWTKSDSNIRPPRGRLELHRSCGGARICSRLPCPPHPSRPPAIPCVHSAVVLYPLLRMPIVLRAIVSCMFSQTVGDIGAQLGSCVRTQHFKVTVILQIPRPYRNSRK